MKQWLKLTESEMIDSRHGMLKLGYSHCCFGLPHYLTCPNPQTRTTNVREAYAQGCFGCTCSIFHSLLIGFAALVVELITTSVLVEDISFLALHPGVNEDLWRSMHSL